MAKSVKKNVESDENQLVLIHRNQHNLFWHSTLFNEVYLQNDVPVFHTDVWIDDEVPFEQFLTQFQNYVETLEGENPNTWSERTTINRIIKPILEMLGYVSISNDRVEPWLEDEPFSVQEIEGLKTYKPDFIIVNDHKELKYIQNENKSDKKLAEARTSVILPIEAKYWGRIDEYRQNQKEDSKRADKKNNGDGSRVMDFDEQCLKYMEILNKQYGILTDGKTWRLYNLSFSSPNYKPYFQFNLGHMIKHVQNSDFLKNTGDYELFKEEIKYFYFLFRKKALYSEKGDELFVDELLNYSKKYVARVEEDLKDRFVNAMTIACNGFQRAAMGAGESVNIDLIRSVSESHIFNILFLKYCEARNILPIKQDPEGYRKISISEVLDRLERFDPNKEADNLNYPLLKRMFSDINFDPAGAHLYDRLIKLTKIVQDGTNEEFKGFTIKGFKESIFSKEEWKFVQKFKLSNQEMIQILFELGYSESDIQGRKYQQIPYNSFSPRQLGSIYESFLEFKLEKAPEDLAFIKKQWVPANLKSEKIKVMDVPKVKKGHLFFTPNNKERKVTGSYYTPDCVVQFIVQETLSPLFKNKSAQDILKMKVCDPAMGSAHFLSAALNFISKKYIEAVDDETNDDIGLSLPTVKKEILHNCIYGADLNPRAVKLAKMSLWLESALPTESLENLDDQIKCTNSLIDEPLWKNEWKFLKNGIDAVVGNPPYLGESGHKEIFQEISQHWLGKRFYQGKMDLLYFFFHLGIDILKANGRLGFITTNYFTTSSGGKKLRKDFFDRTAITQLINLNELKVFGEATGQHNMITFLEKTQDILDTKIVNSLENGICTPQLLSDICAGVSKKTSYAQMRKSDLFDGEEYYIRSSSVQLMETKSSADPKAILAKIKKTKTVLEDILDISQGVVTGANKVSQKHLDNYKLSGVKKDDGIFILSKKELSALELPKDEVNRLIKPYYKNSDVIKFSSETKTNEYMIYLDKRQFKFENLSSALRKHVNKFLPILKDSVCNPPYIHRPRDKSIFNGKKIVVPYRSRSNVFGYNEIPWYGVTDLYYLTEKNDAKVDIRFALGLLNSKLMYFWLYLVGKRKGEILELFQKPLAEIPFLIPDEKVQKTVIKEVDKLIHSFDEHSWKNLNKIIYEIYGLTKEEIKCVDDLYLEKVTNAESSEGKNKLDEAS